MVGRKRAFWGPFFIFEHKWILDFISFTFVDSKRTKFKQFLFRPLAKFGSKVRKILLTQHFGCGWISYHFVSFVNENISLHVGWKFTIMNETKWCTMKSKLKNGCSKRLCTCTISFQPNYYLIMNENFHKILVQYRSFLKLWFHLTS